MTRTADRTRALLLRAGAGLVVGLLAGWGVGRLAKALGATPARMRASDEWALGLAVLMLAAGAYVWLLAADRRRLGRALEQDADAPASADEVGLFRLQAVLLAATGLAFVLPVLLAPLAQARPDVGRIAFAAEVALLAAQAWVNGRAWRGADEFVRQVTLQAAAVAFVGGQTALILWGAAEKLLGAPPMRAFDALTGVTTVYLAASAVFTLAARKA